MISIAFATYNGEKFIIKQLRSLLCQTLKPDEVIIHDDCSTDRTQDLIQEFITENNLTNWRFSVNEKNLGYKLNFYNTIKETSGDIIFLCDQDDIWIPNKLELMCTYFKKNKKIKVLNSAINYIDQNDALLHFDFSENVSNGGLIFEKLKEGKLYNYGYEYFLLRNISPGCTMAFTEEIKNAYLETPFFEYSHDWAINLLGSFTGNTFFIYIPTVYYRLHAKNTIGVNLNTSLKGYVNTSASKVDINKVSDKNVKLSDHEKFIKQNNNLYYFAREYINHKNSFSKYRDSFIKFMELRKVFLIKDFNLALFLKLFLIYFDYYKKEVGVRGIISDFTFAIRIHQILVKVKKFLMTL